MMMDDDDELLCPLCMEEIDQADKDFLPCPCGYQVCMWCWHHIRENLNGLCPACRTPYSADPHAFSAVDRQEVIKKNREKKAKEKQEKKTPQPLPVALQQGAGVVLPKAPAPVPDRKHLHNYRVVQRNLAYVIGLPGTWASEELLRKGEYFGQYGRIAKMIIHRNSGHAGQRDSTISAYVTFTYKEDARAAIGVLDGHFLEGHQLRASFGTTKYCNNFIRSMSCNNPDCVYLHDMGEEEDRFSKDEITSLGGKIPVPGPGQILLSGGGGPSGTGKRVTGETALPPPLFVVEKTKSNAASMSAMVAMNSVHGESKSDLVPPVLSRASSTASLPAPAAVPAASTAVPVPAAVAAAQPKEEVKPVPARAAASAPVPTPAAPVAPVPAPIPTAAAPVPVPAPVAVRSAPLPRPSTSPQHTLFANAVFPIPTSSLELSMWTAVVYRDSASNGLLGGNPYSGMLSELLDWILPTVDGEGLRKAPHLFKTLPATAPAASTAGAAAGAAGGANLNQLRQIFPGVKLHTGGGAK